MLLSNQLSVPITNISTGITQLSWNGDDSQLIFTGFIKVDMISLLFLIPK